MALALYRKYRPATFAEVVGQEHVTEPLRTALAAKRINHAYLFSGPRGCGKTSSARILARSLNCVQGPTPDPCGVCDSCVALAPEGPGSVDVVELDAASHGGVDDARELRDKAFYAPAQSRYRVFIIDEAHMVTTQGFNALLKIVEEPPDHLVFIFATTEPDKVLPTIRSRTHHYPFRLIPPGAMRALLERTCAAESVLVDPAVYPLLIRAGGGSARDTLSILDQLLAGAGPEGVTYERAVALLGVTDVGLIDDLVDGLATGDGAAVYGTIDRVVEAGHDPRRFATDLLDRLRDLVLLRAVPTAADQGLIAAPEDELARMHAQTDRIGIATLTRYAEILHAGLIEMRGATAPRLLVELLCARMMLPAASVTDAALLQRLETLERRVSQAPSVPAASTAPTVTVAASPVAHTPAAEQASVPPAEPRHRPAQAAPAAESAPAPAPSPAVRPHERAAAEEPPVREPAAKGPATEQPGEQPAALGASDDAVRRIWPELLSQVGKRHKPTLILLRNVTAAAVQGNTVVLSMPTGGLARQLSHESRAAVIREALGQLLPGEWEVRCVVSGGAGQEAPTARPARRPASLNRPRHTTTRPAQPPADSPAPAASQAPSAQPTPSAGTGRGPRTTAGEPDIPLPPEPPADEEPPPPDEGAEPADRIQPAGQAGRAVEPTPPTAAADHGVTAVDVTVASPGGGVAEPSVRPSRPQAAPTAVPPAMPPTASATAAPAASLAPRPSLGPGDRVTRLLIEHLGARPIN